MTFEREYVPLHSIISLEGVKYDAHYRDAEITLLQPRLEALGYYNIEWSDGERDSFGPLTRVCKCTEPMGDECWFIYG